MQLIYDKLNYELPYYHDYCLFVANVLFTSYFTDRFATAVNPLTRASIIVSTKLNQKSDKSGY